jgi:hypothetical protein
MTDPTDALRELADALGTDPPASLADLDPELVSRLAAAVTAEGRRQEAEVARSVDDALHLVPRPFRGIVKRLILP